MITPILEGARRRQRVAVAEVGHQDRWQRSELAFATVASSEANAREVLDAVEPVYPRRCESEAGAVETVEIAFNITRGGVVSGERVAATTNACFNDAALNAARRWRFSPRTVDGEIRPAYDQRHTFTFEKPE